MDKLVKIWKLFEPSTNLILISGDRVELSEFESSETTTEQGYFITKKRLQKLLVDAYCDDNSEEVAIELAEYDLKDLGVD